jgi:hypothetical protein
VGRRQVVEIIRHFHKPGEVPPLPLGAIIPTIPRRYPVVWIVVCVSLC